MADKASSKGARFLSKRSYRLLNGSEHSEPKTTLNEDASETCTTHADESYGWRPKDPLRCDRGARKSASIDPGLVLGEVVLSFANSRGNRKGYRTLELALWRGDRSRRLVIGSLRS